MDNYNKMKASESDKANKEKANRILGNQGSAPDVIYSKSCADKAQMRPYKVGGSVKEPTNYKKGGSMKKCSK